MYDKLESKLNNFKRKWGNIILQNTTENYDWLPAFYMRVAYFKEEFSEKDAKIAVCDGKNDGGFDAVFANPDHAMNQVVIVQSKCYKGRITPQILKSELLKIARTLKEFLEDDIPDRRSENVIKAYRVAVRKFNDEEAVSFVVDFVTNWSPESPEEEKCLKQTVLELYGTLKSSGVDRVRLVLGGELLELAEHWREMPELVKHDRFRLFDGNGKNKLEYKDSAILNLSAMSLRNIFLERDVGMLGLNLRYHVRRNKLHKDVDEHIGQTIDEAPQRFWMLNNGIMIICRDYKISRRGGLVDIYGYSVVNGGQTTYNIAQHLKQNATIDFPIICKLVKVEDLDYTRGKKFAQDIAISANSQKPIERAALVANNVEQRKLGSALSEQMVFYRRKDGDRPTRKQYSYNESVEDIGKLGLAGILLMPTEARNNIQCMFDRPFYDLIFKDDYAKVYSQLLEIRDCYTKFRRKYGKGRKPTWCSDHDEQRVVALGQTFVIAAISFSCRFCQKRIRRRAYESSTAVLRKYAEYCGKTSNVVQELPGSLVEACNCDKGRNRLFESLIKVIYDGFVKYSKSCEDDTVDIDGFMKNTWAFPRYVAEVLMDLLSRKKTFCKQFLS